MIAGIGEKMVRIPTDDISFSPNTVKYIWVNFCRTGKMSVLCHFFFEKWMAGAAKPSDIDDFFRFAVTYHDFGMPLK